jgi:hypothetical protein
MAHCLSGRAAGGAVTLVAVALLGGMMAGCQSHHLNSQLLERELRLQEDQIYRLQDVLDEKCARLEYVVQENASLKRQLGYGDSRPTTGRRSSSAPRSSGGSGDAPGFVPPTVELSDPAPPSTLPPPAAPPVLEGVPPLPQSSPAESGAGGGEAPPAASLMPEVSLPAPDPDEPGSFVPSSAADAAADSFEDGPSFAPTFVSPQAAAPGLLDESARQASALQQPVSRGGSGAIQQLSYTEQTFPETVGITSLPADSTLERIVINRDETRIIDRDANGSADALAVVFEPRDLEERLVTIAGDVVVEVHQAAAAAAAAPLASWSISAADAAATFRSTSRSRGIRLLLPWQSGPQSGFSGLVRVRVPSPRGNLVQAETPVGLP